MDDDVDDGKKAHLPGAKAARDERLAGEPGPAITLRSLDADAQPRPPSGPKSSTASARRQPGIASTASGVDWLDTIIDEVLEDSAKKIEASARLPLVAPPSILSKQTEFADFSIGRAASTVLGQVILGYSPIIEQSQGVIGTRLTVVPVHASTSIDASALLEAISEVWPTDGGIVSLNIASETLLADLLRAHPFANVMIEVPAFVAADPINADALIKLAEADIALLLKGRPLRELPRQVLPCFKYSIVDLVEERRAIGAAPPRGVTRSIPHIQSGVRTMAELRRSFELGAIAVIGWPLHEPLAEMMEASPDRRVVLDAIQRIERGDSTESVDHVLMRDPVLAFELLDHVNSSADLRIETGSMQHAVSMVGRGNLRRWLVHLLSRSVDDVRLRPANFAALRRGLLMRMLAAGVGRQEARGELFMCGVFSLLDRIYARPVGELVQRLALPEHVHAALVDRGGPYFPLLELVRAIESEVPHDIRAASELVFIPPIEINRALLRSLLVASQLERPALAAAAGPTVGAGGHGQMRPRPQRT